MSEEYLYWSQNRVPTAFKYSLSNASLILENDIISSLTHSFNSYQTVSVLHVGQFQIHMCHLN